MLISTIILIIVVEHFAKKFLRERNCNLYDFKERASYTEPTRDFNESEGSFEETLIKKEVQRQRGSL